MISAPPVKNPEHQQRIVQLDEAYAKLCRELGVEYLDLQAELPSAYVEDLADGLHPGARGNLLIAERLLAAPIMREWFRN